MKFILVSLLSFFAYQISVAQMQRYEDGPYKSYYKTGEVKTKGQILNGEFFGKWYDYYLNGQVSKEYAYEDGKLSLFYIEYFEDGTISEESKSEDGLHVVLSYFETGNLKTKRQFKSGFFKKYSENGDLEIESNYQDFVLNGNWKSYHKNGNLKWQVMYLDGYRNGVYKKFFENGQVELEGVIIENKKKGEEKRYNKDGTLNWKGSYNDDVFVKTWIQYDSNKAKISKVKFKDGAAVDPANNNRLEPTIIPDGVREKLPVFPGCEGVLGNRQLKNCMSQKISRFIVSKFNTNIASENGFFGKNRIFVIFKISRLGEVYKVRARAPHPALEKEAIRVVKLLPRMEPAYQDGEPVEVPYSLPILFQL